MKVVHCKKDPYDVYVGRPSIFGNPYSHKSGTLAQFTVHTVEEAVAKYEDWVRQQPHILERLPDLVGKTLGCWCAPKGGLTTEESPFKCHGQVLIKLVNEMLEEETEEEE